MHREAEDENFNEQFRQLFASDWQRLNDDWRLFVANLDYGYDFARMELEIVAGKPLTDQGRNRLGRRRPRLAIEPGATRSRRAHIACGPRADIRSPPGSAFGSAKPGGVTIHYYQGRPLGMLAGRRATANDDGNDGLLHPMVVGLGTTFRAAHGGTLYFRINESAGRLADNSGMLEVEIAGANESSAAAHLAAN